MPLRYPTASWTVRSKVWNGEIRAPAPYERIPAALRERFRRETIAHLRSQYAAMIDDPRMPFRHRIADRLYETAGRIPLFKALSRRVKALASSRS